MTSNEDAQLILQRILNAVGVGKPTALALIKSLMEYGNSEAYEDGVKAGGKRVSKAFEDIQNLTIGDLIGHQAEYGEYIESINWKEITNPYPAVDLENDYE